jgi:hypothetical protein
MTLRLTLLIAATIALLVIGAGAAGANRGVVSTITWLEDPGHEPGSAVTGAFATQQRGYYSITAQVHTTGLTPGHRYTLWWVIYNSPASCVDSCGADDLAAAVSTGSNPAGIGVHFGGSVVVNPNGKLQVGTRILEHAVVGCQNSAPYKALCNPLIDAAVAEATVFLHDHGPAVDGPPVAAVDAFAAGCKSYKRLDAVVAAYGETGFDCFSPQSVHLP